MLQAAPQDDSGQAGHGTNGKVDPTDQNHESHSDRDDADHHGLVEDIPEIVGGQKMRGEERKRRAKDQREREHSDFQPRHQFAPERTLSGRGIHPALFTGF